MTTPAASPSRIGHRARVVEAAAVLCVVRILLTILSFRTLLRWTGGAAAAAGPHDVRTAARPAASAVGAAVERAALRLPWTPTCLVQSLSARLMLLRRRVPSTIVLGVARRGPNVEAHAWLLVEGGVVCGGREAAAFEPIAAFQGPGPERR